MTERRISGYELREDELRTRREKTSRSLSLSLGDHYSSKYLRDEMVMRAIPVSNRL